MALIFWDIVTLIMHTYDLSALNCFDQRMMFIIDSRSYTR